MPYSESRFGRLEARVDGLAKRLDQAESTTGSSRKMERPWPVIGGAAAVVVTVIISAITATHVIDSEISGKFQPLSERMGKAESAIKVLANQQSQQTQQLIQQLLATAKDTSNPEIAIRAVSTASSLISILKHEKATSPPNFFEAATKEIQQIRTRHTPRLESVSFTAQKELANYRSSQLLLKQIPWESTTWHFECRGSALPNSTSLVIRGMTATNCTQVLDHTVWDHVIFVNSRIIYRGGPLHLKDVYFINCTFEVQQGDRGLDVLQYAARAENELKIHPELIRKQG